MNSKISVGIDITTDTDTDIDIMYQRRNRCRYWEQLLRAGKLFMQICADWNGKGFSGVQERVRQKKEYEMVVGERDVLGTQLVRRNDEVALLYQKIRLQQAALHQVDSPTLSYY